MEYSDEDDIVNVDAEDCDPHVAAQSSESEAEHSNIDVGDERKPFTYALLFHTTTHNQSTAIPFDNAGCGILWRTTDSIFAATTLVKNHHFTIRHVELHKLFFYWTYKTNSTVF